MVGDGLGVGGIWLLSIAHFASGQSPLLLLAASATACLKYIALTFLMADPLGLSASREAFQASALNQPLCYLLALLAFLTSWVSSLDHLGTEKEVRFDKGMCWATASLIHLTNLPTHVSISLQFSNCLGNESSSLALKKSAALSASFYRGLGACADV
jgi:hypothetical protein